MALQSNEATTLYETSMTLSPECMSDLHWQVTNLPTAWKAIATGHPAIEMTSHASKLGRRGRGAQYAMDKQPKTCAGLLLKNKFKHILIINELELLAVYFGVK